MLVYTIKVSVIIVVKIADHTADHKIFIRTFQVLPMSFLMCGANGKKRVN